VIRQLQDVVSQRPSGNAGDIERFNRTVLSERNWKTFWRRSNRDQLSPESPFSREKCLSGNSFLWRLTDSMSCFINRRDALSRRLGAIVRGDGQSNHQHPHGQIIDTIPKEAASVTARAPFARRPLPRTTDLSRSDADDHRGGLPLPTFHRLPLGTPHHVIAPPDEAPHASGSG
jgi:hypothetical protein